MERLRYNPKPEDLDGFFKPGVTKGYLVAGFDGVLASVADVVAMTDDDGGTAFEIAGEFQPARIVKD